MTTATRTRVIKPVTCTSKVITPPCAPCEMNSNGYPGSTLIHAVYVRPASHELLEMSEADEGIVQACCRQLATVHAGLLRHPPAFNMGLDSPIWGSSRVTRHKVLPQKCDISFAAKMRHEFCREIPTAGFAARRQLG